jgi:NADH dehydrogenase FAD-containing subunit
MSGFFAKLAWAFIHVQFLVLPSSRLSTALQWLRSILTGQRFARLIVEPEQPKS